MFAVHARSVLHVSADLVHGEFIVAVSVKRLVPQLLCIGLSGALLTLLAIYAFAENFKVVTR